MIPTFDPRYRCRWVSNVKFIPLVPVGTDFSTAEALIYGKAFFNSEKLTVKSRVDTSDELRLQSVKDAKTERLDDVKRAGNGAAFQLYRYINPTASQQPAKIVAFGEDTDKEGNLYGVQIVITAQDEAKLKKGKAAFLDILKQF